MNTNTNTNTKKVCLIVAEKDFRDEELFDTKTVLENKGFNVTVASTTTNTITGMLGGTATPDILIKDVNANNFDSIVFVGGMGSQQYFNDDTAHNIAKNTANNNKVLGAICIAPSILANSGLLNGKRATVWAGDESFIRVLRDNNAEFTGEDVTVDGNIVTANGPTAARKFGETIAKLL